MEKKHAETQRKEFKVLNKRKTYKFRILDMKIFLRDFVRCIENWMTITISRATLQELLKEVPLGRKKIILGGNGNLYDEES